MAAGAATPGGGTRLTGIAGADFWNSWFVQPLASASAGTITSPQRATMDSSLAHKRIGMPRLHARKGGGIVGKTGRPGKAGILPEKPGILPCREGGPRGDCRAGMPGSCQRAEARQANTGTMPVIRVKRSRGSVEAEASRAILPSSRRLAPPPAAWAARLPAAWAARPHRQRRNRCQTKSVIAVSTTTAPITSASSSGCVNGPPAHPQSGRQATITAALARHRLGP